MSKKVVMKALATAAICVAFFQISGCADLKPENIAAKKQNLSIQQFIDESFRAEPSSTSGSRSYVARFNDVESSQLYRPRRFFEGYCTSQSGTLTVERTSTINPIGPDALLPPTRLNSSEERVSDYLKLLRTYSAAVSNGAVGTLKCVDTSQNSIWRVSIEPETFTRGDPRNLLVNPQVRLRIKAL